MWDWWVRWVFSCASSDFSFFTVSDFLGGGMGGPAFVVVEDVEGLLVVLVLPVPLPLLVLPLLLGAVLGLLLLAGCKIDG